MIIIYSYSMAKIVHIARACFTQEEEITSIFIWFRGAEENNHVFWWFYIYILTWKIIMHFCQILCILILIPCNISFWVIFINFNIILQKNWKITGKGIHRSKTLCKLAGKYQFIVECTSKLINLWKFSCIRYSTSKNSFHHRQCTNGIGNF